VCVKDAIFGWLDVGHFLHFTQPLPNNAAGFELRSRFWLGDVDLPTDVRAPMKSFIMCRNKKRTRAAMLSSLLTFDARWHCLPSIIFSVLYSLCAGESLEAPSLSSSAARCEHPRDAQRLRSAH